MRERNHLEDEGLAEVIQLRQPTMPVWNSEEERAAFMAEANRRQEAGESLKGMDLPLHLEQEPHE